MKERWYSVRLHSIHRWGPFRPRNRKKMKKLTTGNSPSAVYFSLRMPMKMADEVKAQAFKNGTTVTEWIRDAIERKLKDEEK